ncbi:MAG: ATP-binding protein [Rikenellaceae bacterium]
MLNVIKPKERNAIINSLRSGVVPQLGLQHIQVGRAKEIESLKSNIDSIADGGTAFRFVIGDYGSGKTFFMQLVKGVALEKGLVTMHADLDPNKRLYGRDGQVRHLFSELISNISTRTKQNGGALVNILEKFISVARTIAEKSNKSVDEIIHFRLRELNEYVGGYDFAKVVAKYWDGYNSSNDNLKDSALRWLKGEYTTKTDALRDLGIRTYIDDTSFYDSLKLYAVLARKAGYKGLLVCLDEMVNLYKIATSQSRKNNYEEILKMLNDSLQGNFSGIGFIMGGTPDFLTDSTKGLYSYEALKTRLEENNFAKQLSVVDYNSTVIRLSNLTKEELYLLLQNLRYVFASGDKEKYLVPDEALVAYLNHCSEKIGDSYFRTPRPTIKQFLDLLSLLEQNPNVKWSDAVEYVEIAPDCEETEVGAMAERVSSNYSGDEFSTFKL